MASLPGDATAADWREAFSSRRRNERVVITIGRPFLVRRTTLPIAAAANLDRLLRYEMDRLTPFGAGDVLFSHRVLSRDAAGGTLLAEMAVVPKDWAADPLQRLAALSIRAEALEEQSDISEFPGTVAGMPGALRRIALDNADPTHRARTRLAWRIGTGACAALAVAVIAVPFIRQSIALGRVEDQIAQLRPGMTTVDRLRRQITAGSAGAGQIAAARAHAAVALRALGVLTDLLPDDTVLTTISLRQDHLTIEGRSTAATKLIAAMASDPQLTNPSFGAPVVRAENGTDVFTIQAGFGS